MNVIPNSIMDPIKKPIMLPTRPMPPFTIIQNAVDAPNSNIEGMKRNILKGICAIKRSRGS